MFKEKGWGMSDNQALIYYFGRDILEKGVMIFQLRKQNNLLIGSLKDSTLEQKRANDLKAQELKLAVDNSTPKANPASVKE